MTTAPSPPAPGQHGLVDRERLEPIVGRRERELGAVGRLDQREQRRVALDGRADGLAAPQEDAGAPVGRARCRTAPGRASRSGAPRSLRPGRSAARPPGRHRRTAAGRSCDPGPAPSGVTAKASRGDSSVIAGGRGQGARPSCRRPRGRPSSSSMSWSAMTTSIDLVIRSVDRDRRERDRGGRVAVHRFGQDEGLRDQPSDRLAVAAVGHDHDVERVDERREPRHRTFERRSARRRSVRRRPEPRRRSAAVGGSGRPRGSPGTSAESCPMPRSVFGRAGPCRDPTGQGRQNAPVG